ncbi:arginase [Mycena olivaceomarginata]|nr:arginase [Mycena olivaceomarginata]
MPHLGCLCWCQDPSGIVGCPFRLCSSSDASSSHQPRAGAELGPIHVVQAGLVKQLSELGWEVKFNGHLQFDAPNPTTDLQIGKLRLVSKAAKTVAEVVAEHAKMGALPVTLGGDHSLAMGTISGTLDAYPDVCVFYIDAHIDINTTTSSGNIHGMPLSFVLGLDSEISEFAWVKPVLKPDRLVYIGLRDVDHSEQLIMKPHKIKAFSMHDVDKYEIGKLPIHLSFNIDVLDPFMAPSTVYPVDGRLTFREGQYICEALWETGLLVAMDLVEVNPLVGDTDSVKRTVNVGCSLIQAALVSVVEEPCKVWPREQGAAAFKI